MKLMIATTVLALCASSAFAQDVENPDFAKPRVSLIEAADIANSGAKGDLVAVELEYITKTDPVYIAEIDGELNFARIMIDGENGEVLATEQIEATDAAALDAYMNQFSTEAEMAEMTELALMINGAGFEFDEMDLSEDELAELKEMFEQNSDDTVTND